MRHLFSGAVSQLAVVLGDNTAQLSPSRGHGRTTRRKDPGPQRHRFPRERPAPAALARSLSVKPIQAPGKPRPVALEPPSSPPFPLVFFFFLLRKQIFTFTDGLVAGPTLAKKKKRDAEPGSRELLFPPGTPLSWSRVPRGQGRRSLCPSPPSTWGEQTPLPPGCSPHPLVI